MSKVEHMTDSKMFEDIRELCVLCAKGIVVIAQEHNENPRLVSKLFIQIYQKINDDVESSLSDKK